MKPDALVDAIEKAKEFLRRAKKVSTTTSYVKSGAEAASCKRASLDLSRALAKMRKP